MNIETTDTGAPATATDAQVVDTATAAAPAPAPSEDDAILAAIRGEEPTAETDPAPEAKEEGKAAEGKPVDATAGKGEEKGGNAEPKPEAKADDAILDEETPKDYKGRTREQFDKLKEQGRRYREEAQALNAKLTELAPAIEREANFSRLLADSEGTPEDIGTAISLIRAVNKGTIEERRNALQVVNALRGIIAEQIGEVLPETDVFAAYPDLKQRVSDGDLSEADARELAGARRKAKAGEETAAQLAERQRKEREQAAASEAENAQRQTAARDVQAMATQYRQRDGEAVYKIRATYATQAYQSIIDAHGPVPADKAVATFKRLYESDQAQMLVDAAAVTTRQANTGGVRPLMGAARGGAQAQVVAMTEEDAVLQALRGG